MSQDCFSTLILAPKCLTKTLLTVLKWGTAAEALLELYDNELSVFGPEPFPGGKIPSVDPNTVFALRYAKQFINVNGQTFVADGAVGDPASLSVSAILIGQTESNYIDASNREADYILYI